MEFTEPIPDLEGLDGKTRSSNYFINAEKKRPVFPGSLNLARNHVSDEILQFDGDVMISKVLQKVEPKTPPWPLMFRTAAPCCDPNRGTQDVDIKECTRTVESEMREIETASVDDCENPRDHLMHYT